MKEKDEKETARWRVTSFFMGFVVGCAVGFADSIVSDSVRHGQPYGKWGIGTTEPILSSPDLFFLAVGVISLGVLIFCIVYRKIHRVVAIVSFVAVYATFFFSTHTYELGSVFCQSRGFFCGNYSM